MVNTLIFCYLTVPKLIINSDAQSVIPIALPPIMVSLIVIKFKIFSWTRFRGGRAFNCSIIVKTIILFVILQ